MPQASVTTTMTGFDLLRKYDVNGPRYTSYPTAAQFDVDFTDKDYLNQIHGGLGREEPLSLYIHLPFCSSICYYCACNKVVTKDRSVVGRYLEHLHKEMAIMRLQLELYNRPVTQLHWGGGTPTFLSVGEMTQLMHTTAKYFNLVTDDTRDYSIEIDPRTVSETEIDLLRGLGFNRVSLGVQDFDWKVQQSINRIQGFEVIQSLVNYIRTRAFKSINFDLIYGLPHQTVETLQSTLAKTIELSPDRISFYNYAHLPERFKTQRAIDRLTLPTAEQKVEFLSTIIETLTAAGYEYIGMDHFVKSTDTLAQAKREGNLYRNFQGYTVAKAKDLVGLGVSSISSFDRVYVQNQRSLEDYYQLLDGNQLPIEHGLYLEDEDVVRRDAIQRLACHRRIDIDDFENRHRLKFDHYFADSLAALSDMASDDIVKISPDSVEITEKGFPFLRNVCMAFDAYLDQPTLREVRYSKTI